MKRADENIENRLQNLRNGQPFRVPENYFETFAERLKVRIEEEEQPVKRRSLFFYLKPALSLAASIAVVMLLVYVPISKFFPSDKGYITQQQSGTDSVDSVGVVPAAFFTYFSEGQFMSAFSEINDYESETLSTEPLADYIAANYTDYDIIENN